MVFEQPTQKHLTNKAYGKISAKRTAGLADVAQNHIDSFNWALDRGLHNVIRSIRTQRFSLPHHTDGEREQVVSIRLTDPQIRAPFDEAQKRAVTPAECRNKHRTYQGLMTLRVIVEVDGIEVFGTERSFGEVPLMLRSTKCTLADKTPRQLVAVGEDAEECGGYFIINGNEKVFRFLIAQRRNFPFCIRRGGWRSRDKYFSDKGVIIRCVDRCESSTMNVLHYLTNGTAVLQVMRKRELFYLPVMLIIRCLCDISDREIYRATLRDGLENDSFARNCVTNMLQQMHIEQLGNRQDCVSFVASEFRAKLRAPEWYTSEQVVQQFVDEAVLPHLSPLPNRSPQTEQASNRAKAELVCYMLRRLLVFAQDRCAAESPDSLSNQEVISAGCVWLCILRDALERALYGMQREIVSAFERVHNRKRKAVDGAGNDDTPVENGNVEGEQFKRGRGRKSVVNTLTLSNPESYQRLVMDAFSRASSAFHRVNADLNYVFATGNVPRSAHVQIHQVSGLTVTAERINMQRFVSHFRAVHRGQYFTHLRTTECRRLSGEAWGFICPVHTPDGAPCGLLNHLTACAMITPVADLTDGVKAALASYGMLPCELTATSVVDFTTPINTDDDDALADEQQQIKTTLFDSNFYDVIIDGQPAGRIASNYVERAVEELRLRKCDPNDVRIPNSMELCLVRHSPYASQFPGLYIFCHANRIIRPVYNLKASQLLALSHQGRAVSPAVEQPKFTEWIGTFEQVYLNIAVYDAEILAGITTHREICPQAILSIIASFTPFSEMNPSPRNMYQCQMGKQTIGIPTLAFSHRADSKLYRLETPQSPLVRSISYDQYDMDAFPIGTNAVVAVIAYSGYTMEDAIVMNRASVERGFTYGTIIKSEHVDVVKSARERSMPHANFAFGFLRQQAAAGVGQFMSMSQYEYSKCLSLFDVHGLPRPGARLYKNDPFYCVVDLETKEQRVEYFTGAEVAYVVSVKVLELDVATRWPTAAVIAVRIPRPPIIGDKLASRCGQKGICARLIPPEDMPFIGATGVVPDILFNAHGFGSRMTMSKVCELMAGKYAASSGKPVNSATFNEYTKNDEPDGEQYYSPALYFGDKLREIGFEDSGVEIMYHGAEGTEIEARIYCGVIYYQRLRHMVSDKYQARPTGPSDPLTLQPIKGRKRGGGIRVGEMERDAMLAHGISFMLNDRLLNCSDRKTVRMCRRCGDLLSVYTVKSSVDLSYGGGSGGGDGGIKQWSCLLCGDGDAVVAVTIPWVLRYMAVELAALNIRLKFQVTKPLCDVVA